MYLYNPETFDPLASLPPSLHKFADDARYIIHKLYITKVLNKKYNNSFVPLKTEYLRKIISERKCLLIKQSLIDSGDILTDGHWIRGAKAIGYMLSDKFDEIPYKKIEVTNKRLEKKLTLSGVMHKVVTKTDEHKHLVKYLKQLTINYDQALSCVEFGIVKNSLSMDMLRDGTWFFTPDDYGRVHSNISNLNSCLRSCIRWNNKCLVNIDICNSQPLFLGVILYDFYVNNCKLLSFILPPPSSLYRIPCDILPQDVEDFIHLVEIGKIYEYIANVAGVEVKNRKKFKQKIFSEILFCEDKGWVSEYSNLFESLFPNVYNFIVELKKGDYADLAKLLQQVESNFMIDGVVGRCMREYPEMPVFTIHDSIMTTEEYVETLQNIMLEEFAKLGVRPKLHIEP